MITARYFLVIKTDEDKEERYKARYVASGYFDIMKYYLVHGEQTIQCISVHIILVVANINGIRIRVVDIKHAYFQSDKHLIRKIFIINPAPEFELFPEEFLELLKPISGLAYSGDE